MTDSNPSTNVPFHSAPQFPYHTTPRTWLITSGLSACGLRLARILLQHGDNVALGTPPAAFDEVSAHPEQPQSPRRPESATLYNFLEEDFSPPTPSNGSGSDPVSPSAPAADTKPKRVPKTRLRPVRLDPRATAQCQGAIAQATTWFGGVDVLVCNSSEVLIGTVEELGIGAEERAMVKEQFEWSFYANVNAIKAALPGMRKRGGGHIVVVTGITSHLGTPGLGAFCSAGWALEGYCDSIAYEIAPFNIKISIIQPHLETAVLPNRIKAAALLAPYSPATHPAPLARNSIGALLDRIQGLPSQSTSTSDPTTTASAPETRRDSAVTAGSDSPAPSDGKDAANPRPIPQSLGNTRASVVQEPRKLPEQLMDALLEETLFSICAIGGHPNPPQRHIVGTEAVISVKEKLKTVSIELEDLVGTSTGVDLAVGGEGE